MIRSKILHFLVVFITMLDLITCGVQGLAWFTTSQTVDTVGMQMRIEATKLDLTYNVYKYIDEIKAAADVTEEPDAFTLAKYDSVILERNQNTSIIIRFEFNITATAPLYIISYCTEATANTHFLSNIVELKFGIIPNFTATTPNDIYTEAAAYFNNISPHTFKNGNSKELTLTYFVTNYSQYINQGKLDLFLQLDYSETLINDFTFSLEDSETTEFLNDLTLIRCYVEN